MQIKGCSNCKHYDKLYRMVMQTKNQKNVPLFIVQKFGSCKNKETSRNIVRKTYYCEKYEEYEEAEQ